MVRPTFARLLPITLFLSALGVAQTASAHLGSTKYLTVSRVEGGVRVVALVETVDVAVGLGLPPDAGERALTARARDIGPWLARDLTVTTDSPCRPRPGAPGLASRDGRRFVVQPIVYLCDRNDRFTLRDTTVFPEDAQHEGVVDWVDGGHQVEVLRRGRQSILIGDVPRVAPTAGRFFSLGTSHFATGYDHILFLLSLILPAGLVARREGWKEALRDLVWLVTAFTLGHSLTLAIAALGWVALPSKPVEVTIAVSIVAVALHNVLRPTARGPVRGLAFGFGLVHGFGFSSVLLEVGLPAHTLLAALVTFNLGIEFAQLFFLALVLGPLYWATRFATYERFVVKGGSAFIALLGALWIVERLAA